jgi:hypothetical protein
MMKCKENKVKLSFYCVMCALLMCEGCFISHPAPTRYTLGLDEVLASPTQTVEEARGMDVKVTMSPDLQAMTMPYVCQPDGRVTTEPTLSYYAALPLLIEREVEMNLDKLALPKAARMQIVVMDYCIDLRGEEPLAVVGLKVNGVYRRSHVTLAEAYTAQELRKAFAIALVNALQQK